MIENYLEAMRQRPSVSLEEGIGGERLCVSTPGSNSISDPLDSPGPFLAGFFEAYSEPPASATSLPNVPYHHAPYFNHPTTLRMDLLLPKSATPHPLVVFFPGGGFVMADRRAGLVHRHALVQAGYAVASVEYRVGLGTRFPALVEDAEAAVDFLRAHAPEYSIDPSRVALMGNSAGGYVATMAGLRRNDVQAVIDLYGVADLDLIGCGLGEDIERVHRSPATTEAILVNGPAFGRSPGASVFDTPEKTAEASPTPYVTSDAPPFLILHGSADTLVSPVGSKVLHEELLAAGAESERYVIEGAPHGGPLFDAPEVIERMLAFLKRHLR